MNGWIIVRDHPYVAITDNNGVFDIPNLPPGNYTLRWVPTSGLRQTSPAGGSYDITLADSQALGGQDFGLIDATENTAPSFGGPCSLLQPMSRHH